MPKPTQKTRTLAQEQAERLFMAMDWADLTMVKLAKKAGLKAAHIGDVLAARVELAPARCVDLAGVLDVDPRWLALGIPSPAGEACRSRLLRLMSPGQMLGRRKMDAIYQAIPEPDKGAGVCRYCLCTDELGCGNCTWVDEEAGSTICSSCLEPGNM